MPLFENGRTFFVKESTIVAAPSDANDGRDPLGCNLSNATYDHAGGGSGERQLTAASGTPFTNVQAGDYIYLMNAVGGVADGLYEIASVPSSTVILLVANSGLTADSTADVDSSDGPWGGAASGASLQTAIDNINTTGDHLVICADGNESGGTDWELAATIDWDVASGGGESFHYHGANNRGVIDGTRAVLSGAGHTTHVATVGAAGEDYWNFYDLEFANAAGVSMDGVYAASTGNSGFMWFRCKFTGNSGAGIFHNSDMTFADCEFSANTAQGATIGGANRGGGKFFRCRFHDNGTDGLQFWAPINSVIDCLVYDNGGDGIEVTAYYSETIISGCTIYGNTGDGISVYGNPAYGAGPMITNCVIAGNGAYGIAHVNSTSYTTFVDYCLFHSNTSGHLEAPEQIMLGTSPSAVGDHNIYDDNPDFESVTDGSEDFTPASGSPLIDAGFEVPVK